MKLAFVTPRYGREVVGGAELGARLLAEHLAALDGWTVEVLTTCARDAWTWANEYPAGTAHESGVTVRRFPVAGQRDPDFRRLTLTLLAHPERVDDTEGQDWIVRQGPVAPALIDAISASDHDLIAFTPYLYHPTVAGLPLVAERAILHPAAHDEPAIRLPLFDSVFEAARGVAFYSEGERAITEELFPSTVAKPQVVVGLGIDPPPTGSDSTDLGALVGRPYLMCLGRVDHSKGTHLLVSLFAALQGAPPWPARARRRRAGATARARASRRRAGRRGPGGDEVGAPPRVDRARSRRRRSSRSRSCCSKHGRPAVRCS